MIGRKKKDQPRGKTAPASPKPPAAEPVAPSAPRAPAPSRPEPRAAARQAMTIGKSVHIDGELTGNEEITIEGSVTGRISVQDHQLTIGVHGRIRAAVHAKSVLVLGRVEGDITADERAEVSDGGFVEGDIHAPKVVLAEGAKFKGNIDMVAPASPAAPPAESWNHAADAVVGDDPNEFGDTTVDDVHAPPRAADDLADAGEKQPASLANAFDDFSPPRA